MTDPQVSLSERLAATEARIAELSTDHARIVAASQSTNADDEHDPEGSTIAYERQLLASLLNAERAERDDLLGAVARIRSGTYGRCEVCGEPIGEGRLAARPEARTCVICAA